MNSSIVILFYLNIIALSPIMFSVGVGAIFLRVIQLFSIIVTFPYWKSVHSGDNRWKMFIWLLFLYFVSTTISEFFHSSFDYTAVSRLFIHVLYIQSVYAIVSKVSDKDFYRGLMFVGFCYLFDAWISLSAFSMYSNIGLDLDSLKQMKAIKRSLFDIGYDMGRIHIIPLICLMIFPYLKKKLRLFIMILSLYTVLLTATITALGAYIGALLVWMLCSRYKLEIKSKHVLGAIFLIAILLVVLVSNNFVEVYEYTTGRSMLWMQAISSIISAPLFGISGTDFYSNIYQYFMSSNYSAEMVFNENRFDFTSGSCHNMYLHVMLFHGIIAGVIFLFIIRNVLKTLDSEHFGIEYKLPLLYLLIRGFGEASGFIETSSATLEFLFDIYLCRVYYINKKYEKSVLSL